MHNPFSLIPALYRKWVYGAYGTLLLVVGALQVGFNEAAVEHPTWYVVTAAIVKYLGIPIAAMATSNVGPEDRPKPAPEN